MVRKIRYFLWRILGIDYNQTLKVHDYVFLKNDKFTSLGIKTYDNGALVWRWTEAPITIGKFCSIGNNVNFIVDEGYHQISQITSFPLINNLFKDESQLFDGIGKNEFLKKMTQREGITIGNDVWIGLGAYIMPGVTVGNGVTIAANSVVTKNVEDYVVVAGVPAKVIKHKHDKQIAKKLNNIAWWDWSQITIKERVLDFYLKPIDFVKKYDK